MAAQANVRSSPGEGMAEFTTILGEHVHRVAPDGASAKLITGMTAELPRLTCWTIAEHTGQTDAHTYTQ